MPRFVILEHTATEGAIHWDLMLENHGVLLTWSLEPQPALWQRETITAAATQRPDHRLAYLDYEGNISGGRGRVERLESGDYEPLGSNRYRLAGERFFGILEVLPDRVVFTPAIG